MPPCVVIFDFQPTYPTRQGHLSLRLPAVLWAGHSPLCIHPCSPQPPASSLQNELCLLLTPLDRCPFARTLREESALPRPSRICGKQRTYRFANPFRIRTYRKEGGGGSSEDAGCTPPLELATRPESPSLSTFNFRLSTRSSGSRTTGRSLPVLTLRAHCSPRSFGAKMFLSPGTSPLSPVSNDFRAEPGSAICQWPSRLHFVTEAIRLASLTREGRQIERARKANRVRLGQRSFVGS